MTRRRSHAHIVGSLAAVGLLFTAAGAAPFFEPKDNYYRARGTNIAVTWSVDRTEVPDGGTLTATLTIRGAVNPHEIVRPDLAAARTQHGRTYGEFFEVEGVPGTPARPDVAEVAFVYRLRPRGRSVTRLPTLEFWFHSGQAIENPFQKTRATGIDITVTEAVVPKPPAAPLVAPEHLFDMATGSKVLGRAPFVPGGWAWAGLAIAMPLAAAGWYLAWRRVYPDAARLARQRRSRAVRRAAAAIRASARSADPAGAIAAAVLSYLRSRFLLPPGSETPIELGTALRTAGLSEAAAEEATAFFRRCDAARFAPPGDTPLSLAADAEALVARLEAVE